jgi:hypothetical protein
MTKTMTDEDEEDLAASELGHQFIDELCSSSPLIPSQPPLVMLKALGVILANIALVKGFGIGVDEGLAIVGRHAHDLYEECRILENEERAQ